jgi:outer membrane lipoprotein-sorting protein
MKKLVLVLFAAALLGIATPAHAASPDLGNILHQLDVASTGFHTAQAEFKWDQYTKVVDSTDTQTGTIYFQRGGTAIKMAAQVRQLNGQDDPKTVVYDGVTLRLYQPRIKGQYESFLTLGFGGSGKDLAANWEIKLIGMETIAGTQVAHLELTSKQESVRNMFSSISIWVDPARGVSLKQIFTEPSGDSRTAYYTGIKMNASIEAKTFSLDAKALGAQVVIH